MVAKSGVPYIADPFRGDHQQGRQLALVIRAGDAKHLRALVRLEQTLLAQILIAGDGLRPGRESIGGDAEVQESGARDRRLFGERVDRPASRWRRQTRSSAGQRQRRWRR
ncbi:MAG: hypothetical protein U1F35_09230 [Steroidobacteraceae bacterium]